MYKATSTGSLYLTRTSVLNILNVARKSHKMTGTKKLTKEEELLLQDFSRNVTTKSSALFYGNAFIVSAVPICKYLDIEICRCNMSYTGNLWQMGICIVRLLSVVISVIIF